MSLFGASPKQLRTAAQRVQDAAQYIEGLRKGVDQLKVGLVGQSWKGGAATQFANVLNEWDARFRKDILEDLERIFDKLNVAAGVYSASEADTHNMVLNGADPDIGAGQNKVDSIINAGS